MYAMKRKYNHKVITYKINRPKDQMKCATGVVISGQWHQASNNFLPFTLYLIGF